MVIDFHLHYSAWGGQLRADDTPQRTLDLLAGHGVDAGLIAPMMGLFSCCTDHRPENDELYEYCNQAPGRLFAAFTVNPLMGKVALDEVRRCKEEHSAHVLKLHPWLQGFSISSPEMDEVARLCEELGIAILFHDGTPVYSNPFQLARLCRDFPGLTVIAGHAGLGDLWREAMLAAQRYPNYILCLCGPRELAMREIVENVPPQQITIGSDHFTSNADDSVMWFRWRTFRELGLPSDIRDIIERKTPARILGLSY